MESMTIEIFYSYILAVIISAILTPIASKIGDYTNIVAKENNRTIHHGRIARMGGLAIYLSFLIAACVFLKADRQINAILVSSFIIFILGFIDDMVDLKPKIKLLGQFIAASIVIFYGDMYIHNINIPFLFLNHSGSPHQKNAIFFIICYSIAFRTTLKKRNKH